MIDKPKLLLICKFAGACKSKVVLRVLMFGMIKVGGVKVTVRENTLNAYRIIIMTDCILE